MTPLRENFQTHQFDQQTQKAILNERTSLPVEGVAGQQIERKRALVNAYITDQFGANARGNNVYLVGWSDVAGDDVTLSGATFTPLDTTLYFIQLASDVQPAPAGQLVAITPDQFTWSSIERTSVSGEGLNNMTILPGASVVMQYTPLPGAVLDQVDELDVYMDRSSGFGRQVVLELWNWERGVWEAMSDTQVEDYSVFDPQRYLGDQNAVRVRLSLDVEVSYGSAWVRRFGLTQRGQF
jgi:hypothetical protein